MEVFWRLQFQDDLHRYNLTSEKTEELHKQSITCRYLGYFTASSDYTVKPGARAGPDSLKIYLDFKPECPRVDVQAVRVEDKILSAEVEMRRSVSKGPGGEAGSSVRHQVQRHVTGACARQENEKLEHQHFC